MELSERYAHAILLVNGRYALQLRDAGARVAAGTWGFFGGKIEPGEAPIEAVCREIAEELELYLETPLYLGDVGAWSFFVADVTDQWAHYVLHEGARAALFTFEEVQDLPRHQIVIDALELHRAKAMA